MEYTENYKLAKPGGALKFDPDYDNGNYDIIDTALKANADAAEAAQKAADEAAADIDALNESLGRRFELISEITIADGDEIYEAVVEGSFERIYIDAYLAPLASQGIFALKLNDSTSALAAFTNTTAVQYASVLADIIGGRIFASATHASAIGTSNNLVSTPYGYGCMDADAITKILLMNVNQTCFAAGTTFKIYAVKKEV